MVKIDRVSLGFDLRMNPNCVQRSPIDCGRLLEPRCISPISADPAVWPNVKAAVDLWSGLLPSFLNPLHLSGDLQELIEAYRRENISVDDLFQVCITCEPSIVPSLNTQFGKGYFNFPTPEHILLSEKWKLQGFDVVDLDGMISGLKGCDYHEPSWNQLKMQFGECLNEKGLFLDTKQAKMFAEVRGLEIAAHAPFVAVGVLTR